MNRDWTIDELLCVAMAREIESGDVVLEGIGTFLPSAAYELARATHAPELTVFSPLTGGYRDVPLALGLDDHETAAARATTRKIDYAEMVLWHLPAYLPRRPERWKEFLRPAQIDRAGNTNNVSVRSPTGREVRLPGGVGIPDTMALHERVFLYLPRHEARAFVERVDVISGAGAGLGGTIRRTAPQRLITDLGVFDFVEGGPRVVSLHPGVEMDDVRTRTGIAVAADAEPQTTKAPTPAELDLLRTSIDPLGLRTLEFIPSRDRVAALRAMRERATT
jgi:acyl CoA:acetate/3-ketoacid CoA transferase beta subunit